MTNTSGLKPKGIAVLVEPYQQEEKSKGGILFVNKTREQGLVADQRAIVIEVGTEAWADESEPRALPGDRVMLAKYTGIMIIGPADGKQYRMVNDKDVFAQITEENLDGVNSPLDVPVGKPEFNADLRGGGGVVNE